MILERLFSSQKTLSPLKKSAWEKLSQQNLLKREDCQYVPLHKLKWEEKELAKSVSIDKKKILPFLLPGSSHIVFVNGYFSEELSDISILQGKASLLPLSKAAHSYGVFLQNRFAKTLKEEKDPFALFNLSTHPEGAFLYVQKSLPAPVQIVHVVAEGESSLFSPRLHIVLSKGAEASFVRQTVDLQGKSYGFNGLIDCALEEDAQVSWLDFPYYSAASWGFQSFRITLKKKASWKSFSFSQGAFTERTSYRVSLLGEESSAILKGLSLLDQEHESHTHVLMEHLSERALSRQHFKMALLGESRASFEGKIFVDKIAQKTESYQLANQLLLSDLAKAYTKPNLEIFADDVKASHGATVSQLGEEELFYLKTRGLSEKEGKKLLTLGFCQEMLEEVFIPEIRKDIEKKIYDSCAI